MIFVINGEMEEMLAFSRAERKGSRAQVDGLIFFNNILHFFLCGIRERTEELDNLKRWVGRWEGQDSSAGEL